MADESQEEQEKQVEKGSKLKKIIVFGVGGLIAFVVIFAAVWFFLGGSGNSSASTGNNAPSFASSNGEAPEVGNALYVGMPRPFVFIVPGDARERTVQIKVQLMVRGENNEELAKRHIPLIEGTLHQVFSSSTAEELKTVDGKEKIRELALREVRKALEKVAGKGLVEQVLFTSLVMQ